MIRKTRWRFEQFAKSPSLKNAVIIEGLPGIGNVGKIVVDFIIDELGAKKLYEISGYAMPNSVFVNDENLVELPKIEMYYKKMKKKNDLLLLTGDVQPIDEESSYEFSEDIVDVASRFKASHIITLGGIGLAEVPGKPKVYCTGNDKKLVGKYKEGTGVDTQLYGVVGPIVGVSGLLVGLAQKKKIKAVSLLSETVGHPMYLGIRAARETLKVLNKKLGLDLDTGKLDKEIADLDREMKKTEGLSSVQKSKMAAASGAGLSYIG